MRNRELITADLEDIDERCRIWARVTSDRPHPMETAIYRAMKLYGGYEPEKNKEDPEPLPPLSRDQISDAWLIDRAWRSPLLILPHKNILQLWYFVAHQDEKLAAKVLRTHVREIAPRLRAALISINNIAARMRNHILDNNGKNC